MEKTLKSGAKMVITPADFAVADGLRKAVVRVAKGLPLGPNLLDVEMGVVKDMLVELASSDEVEIWVMKCAAKATYEGMPISPALFDDPRLGMQARKDFHEMLVAVAWENIGPFFEAALSGLSPMLQKMRENLASPAPQTKG